MGLLRSFLYRVRTSNRERKVARSHLKAAKAENYEQYLALAAKYTDLAQIYFGSTVSEPAEIRIKRVEQVFYGLWQQVRYAERLSDFEFMLAKALIDNTPDNATINSTEALVVKLRLLEPRVRFAFIASQFEDWSLRWVALVMRIRISALHQLLSQARCELCGISWESLTSEERGCLQAVHVALEKSPNLRVNKQLSERISEYPRVIEIRAQWLELRPELVEVRHRYMPSQSERETLLKNILNAIDSAPIESPAFMDRVVNTLHFSRHRKIKVS